MLKQITALILFQLPILASKVLASESLQLTFSSKITLKSYWNLNPSANSADKFLTGAIYFVANMALTALVILPLPPCVLVLA